ncbi:MAG TPA: hypothetical protein VLK85_23695 [Ramlibacter sp.]|nr:hypothetical protein [Ramlibacter sp.]
MPLIEWFSARRKPESLPSTISSTGMSRADVSRPHPAAARPNNNGNAHAARKQERKARRELLYAVVREAMVRGGVLSSTYKFKVLSLDSVGNQFLVMMDLARAANSDCAHLSMLEAMIAQSAKSRHDIQVTAVYWRLNDSVVDSSFVPSQQQPASAAPQKETVAAGPQPVALPLQQPAREASASDALEPEELDALKLAFSAGATAKGELALANVNQPAPAGRGQTRPTGFEDTVLADNDPHPGAKPQRAAR